MILKIRIPEFKPEGEGKAQDQTPRDEWWYIGQIKQISTCYLPDNLHMDRIQEHKPSTILIEYEGSAYSISAMKISYSTYQNESGSVIFNTPCYLMNDKGETIEVIH